MTRSLASFFNPGLCHGCQGFELSYQQEGSAAIAALPLTYVFCTDLGLF
ncbi:hypothetical protein [Laspinema olomoucense]|nr:hypothetical protein [Laspinema sp. D3c]MCT7993063.1 hypothetical protein [Laspinema sp. D3c]